MIVLLMNRDLLSHDNNINEQGLTLNSSHMTIILMNRLNSNHMTILLMNRDLLSTDRVYCLSIIADSSRVSLIIAPHIYTPALETCTSLSVRSNDTVKFPSVVLRGLRSGSTQTTCALMTSIVIFTTHVTVISEPIRNVLEEVKSIETAVENLKF